MKKWILGALLLIVATRLVAQEGLIAALDGHIEGRVVAADSGEALHGAVVAWSSGVGTIANSEGEFALRVGEGCDSLRISCMGYHTQRWTRATLPAEVRLRPRSYVIDKVTVYPVESILEKIWRRYYAIWQREKKLSRRVRESRRETFFYRQTTATDSVYTEFIESFFTADNSYGIRDLRLQKGRYGLDRELPFVTLTNFFQNSQIRPFHQKIPPTGIYNVFIQPNSTAIYDTSVIHTIEEGGDKILVLNFEPKSHSVEMPILSGKLWVRLSDHAILKMAVSYDPYLTQDKRKIFKITGESCVAEVNYIEGIKDYPVVGSVITKLRGRLMREGFEGTFETNFTMLRADYPHDFGRRGVRMGKKDFLLNEVAHQKYDPEFWRENPVVKRTPAEESVVRWFEENQVFGNFIDKK